MHTIAAEQFVRTAGFRGHERILEVGCGDGHATRAMRRLLADSPTDRTPAARGSLVALDACPIARAQTRIHANLEVETHQVPLSIRAYDRVSLPLDPAEESGNFDVVIVRHELQHAPNPAELLEACLAALRPGGRLILVDDDFSTLRLHPAIPGFERVWNHYTDHVMALGRDPSLGRRLPQLIAQTDARTSRIAPLVYGGRAGETSFRRLVKTLAAGLRQCNTDGRLGDVDEVLSALPAWSARPDASLWYSAWMVEARRRVAGFFAMTP